MDRRLRSVSDRELLGYYSSIKLSPVTLEHHKDIANELKDHLRVSGFKAEVQLYGSSANGFGLEDSDVDMIITFLGRKPCSVKEIKDVISRHEYVTKALKIPTVFPLIRCMYDLEGSNYKCDITYNNELGAANTELLEAYSKIDEVAPFLVIMVKDWAKKNGIRGHPYPSSYMWTLMVIHYLQWKNSLPYLQDIEVSSQAHDFIDGHDVYFVRDIELLKRYWRAKCKHQSLTWNFYGFFWYYFKFDQRRAITVREDQDSILSEDDNGLRILDPFNGKDVAAKITPKLNGKLWGLMHRSYRVLTNLRSRGRLWRKTAFEIIERVTFDGKRQAKNA